MSGWVSACLSLHEHLDQQTSPDLWLGTRAATTAPASLTQERPTFSRKKESRFALLFIGIDIGKFSHVASLLSSTLLAQHHHRYEHCPVLTFEQSRSGFDKLLSTLRTYASPEHCHVLLENTGHYGRALEQYLQEHGITVYRVHVQIEARKNKSDKRDAQALAVLLYNQVEKRVLVSDKSQEIHRLVPPSETAKLLSGLVQHRHELIRETTRRKNKLTAICDELFPEFTQVYVDPNTPSALTLREKYPTPSDVASADLDDLCATRKRTQPSKAKLASLQELATHTIGTKDKSRQVCLLLEQKQLIAELKLLEEHVSVLNTEIEKAVSLSREGQILTSFPMIGSIQAATLIAAIGSIANFESIAKLRGYCGWSPRQQQTGTSKDSMSLTASGNHMLKQTLYMITMSAIRLDTPFKALYDRLVPLKCQYDERTQRYRGKMKVVGRVAGQIISVIYVLLRRDLETLASTPKGGDVPEPELYDMKKHTIRRR